VRVECSKCGRLLGYAVGIPLEAGAARVEVGRATITVQVDPVEPIAADHLRDVTKMESSPPASSASTWLYVSRRLELFELPNVPPFTPLLFTVQPAAPATPATPATPALPARVAHLDRPTPAPPPIIFYRLTASTLAWFERMATHFEAEYLAGRQPREQMDEVVRLMTEIWEFAERNLAIGEVRAARATGGSLPERGDAVRIAA
jgi:hypothetical protein